MSAPVILDLPSVPASATRARRVASEYAARMGVDAEDVAIAVAEAVANALIHGYREGGSGMIHLGIVARDDVLEISVTDRGHGMAPNPDAQGLGLGLPMIGSVCESLKIETPAGGGTRLVMTFRPTTTG